MKKNKILSVGLLLLFLTWISTANVSGWTHSWYQPTKSYVPVHKVDTTIWCQESGMSSASAKTVGFHCENVDILMKGDFKWHLDRSNFTGAVEDTRILQSENEMILAKRKLDELATIEASLKKTTRFWDRSKLIIKSKKVKEEALSYLGKSLHPMQDLYAHMDAGIDTPDAELGLSHGMLGAEEVDVLIQYKNGTTEHRIMKIETTDGINIYSFYDDINYDFVDGQWIFNEEGTKEQNSRWIQTRDASIQIIEEFMAYAEGLGVSGFFQ